MLISHYVNTKHLEHKKSLLFLINHKHNHKLITIINIVLIGCSNRFEYIGYSVLSNHLCYDLFQRHIKCREKNEYEFSAIQIKQILDE